MKYLHGSQIYLRALEPEDLDFIYQIENNENIWEVSDTQTPYSYFLIKQYLENAHLDIYSAKQLRLVICLKNNFQAVGLIDLFDFDPKNNRAGVGILVENDVDRNIGIGTEALKLMINYSFSVLNLKQLYANISVDNLASINLFNKFDFELIGTKKAWKKVENQFIDEHMYQLINSKY